MNIEPCCVPVERLNGGEPLIKPLGDGWEGGVTFNSAAVFLERSPGNDPLIRGLLATAALDDPRLKDGVVALHYRARPRTDPGYRWNRSYVGLALFTPELTPLRRLPEPVIPPGERPQDPDYLG